MECRSLQVLSTDRAPRRTAGIVQYMTTEPEYLYLLHHLCAAYWDWFLTHASVKLVQELLGKIVVGRDHKHTGECDNY